MAHVPQVVLDMYATFPRDCFVSGVPFTLRGHDDDEIIPMVNTLPGPDGAPAKWVRFCDFLPFMDACEAYWMQSLHEPVYPVYLYIMPYAPLRDAYYLHELIRDADPLLDEATVSNNLAVQALGLDQNEENGAAAAAPQFKQGTVQITDGVLFTFFVFNYGLLKSKAEKYAIFSYVTKPLDEFLRRLQVTDNLIYVTPTTATEQQYSAANDARRRLALALLERYADGIEVADPHDAILAMFPDMHDEVYEDECEHCHPELYPSDHDISAATLSRLESVFHELKYEDLDINDHLSIPQAEYNLMSAEAAIEFQSYSADVRERFLDARDRIISAMNPSFDLVREATIGQSLMGVLSEYEDGNLGEGN